MYRKDYILRMTEMLAEMIAALLGLLKKGNTDSASQMLERMYFDLLREDAALFRKMNAEEFTDKFLDEHNYTYHHLEILAELFFAEAELATTLQKLDDALGNYNKSKIIFLKYLSYSKEFSFSTENKLKYIQEKINLLTL